MDVWTVDVFWSTHDALQRGITELDWHRVRVAAGDGWEAQLIAAQIVAATQGGMPTKTMLCL